MHLGFKSSGIAAFGRAGVCSWRTHCTDLGNRLESEREGVGIGLFVGCVDIIDNRGRPSDADMETCPTSYSCLLCLFDTL